MSIYFAPRDFNTQEQVSGRTVANDSLLKALIRYGNCSKLFLYMEQAKFFEDFLQNYAHLASLKNCHPIIHGDIPSLQQVGLYMHTDPLISKMSWARSFISPASFSICSIIHAVSGMNMAEEIAKLILAPVRSWDAIICTSAAAKRVVDNLYAQWFDYLKVHYKALPTCDLQLPIIPLGVNPEEITAGVDHGLKRKMFRERYDIAEQDYVVLFVGRLFFYEKAHPIPMYLALEALAKRIGKQSRVHFVQAGWFDDINYKQHYEEAARLFCPSVNVLFINELDTDEKKKSIWPGADVFMSLIDNIQESFGITPLEAMANKLPVIVSDWDGYKDTVRHGIDGFRIPTILPPAGCGTDFSLGYLAEAVNYRTYGGLTAQMTAVDVGACVEALWQLYLHPELRQRMGYAGYQRVHEEFHWQQIIKRYEQLWDELAARRHTASDADKKSIQMPPMIADPFFTFSNYSSTVLQADQYLTLGNTPHSQLVFFESDYLGGFGAKQRLAALYLEKIIHALHRRKMTTQQIVALVTHLDATISTGIIVRSLTYLIKYDFIRVC